MDNYSILVKKTISPREAKLGAKILITRNGKKLNVSIPAGVHSGTKVRLSGALLLTDNIYGDIYVAVKIRNSSGMLLAIFGILLVLITVFDIMANSQVTNNSTTEQVSTINDIDEIVGKNSTIWVNDKVITLINNPNALDPTYSELLDFLKRDVTDQKEYSEMQYNCVDYAKDLHDHAESEGIKSAWVGIDFVGEEVGHALNAFNTEDRGLVFIDVTSGASEKISSFSVFQEIKQSWDTIAYLEIGQPYGVINIDEATGITYDDYISYSKSCERLLLEVEKFIDESDAYDAALKNQYYSLGVLNEWAEILNNWQVKLLAESESFDSCGYESLGIVEKIDITW